MSDRNAKHHRVRVLVVDDHEETLEILHRVLTPRGFDVQVASSVRAAMDMVAARSPEVIVTDIEMPGEDGFALCKSLRRCSSHGEGAMLPVLALTGSDDATPVLLERTARLVMPRGLPASAARSNSLRAWSSSLETPDSVARWTPSSTMAEVLPLSAALR